MNIAKRFDLDIARFIAALMVVAIHIYPFAFLHEDVDYMVTRIAFRIAVPLFLMITGYYVLPKALKNIDVLKKYSQKILKIYLISILIYLPITIYNGYFSNFNGLQFVKDLFINGTFYHLWYFPALLLGLWITYFLLKKIDLKVASLIFILLFLIGLFGDSYYGFVEHFSLLKKIYDGIFWISDYTRNGLFYVPIFLYIGYYCSLHKSNKKNTTLFLFCFLFMLTEGSLLYYFGNPKHSSMYISLLPVSYLLFRLLLRLDGNHKTIRNMATWIYIIHPLFIVVIHFLSSYIKILQHSLVTYIIVVLSTVGFVWIMEQIRKQLNNRKI